MKKYSELIDGFYPEDRDARMLRAMDHEEIIEAALGLAGESGEVVDIIKKVVYFNKPLDEKHLKEELGDTLHYLVRMCTLFGYTVEEIAAGNVTKLEARYGGEAYSDKAAIAQREKGK